MELFRPRIYRYRRRDILHPAGWEVAGLGLLLLFDVVVSVTFGEAAYEAANFIGAVWFGGVLVAGAVRAVRIDPVAMWTGMFWFRLASAVYFGFGSAEKPFFNEYTTQLVDSYYLASPADMCKVNLICAFSAFLFTGCLYVVGIFRPHQMPREVDHASDPVLWICGVVFCVVGYFVKYVFVLPALFDPFRDAAISGLFASMGNLAVAGLFLLTLWCSKYAINYLVVPTLLLGADIITGSLLMSKGEVIFPLIVYILGLCRYRASVKRLFLATAAVLLMFVTLVPAVQFGRAELERRYGSIDVGDLKERFDILSQYFTNGAGAELAGSELNSLARLYYGNATAAAVAQYDGGQPGNSLMDVFTVFIPRAVWPDKPIYDVGGRFNLAVVGDATSSSWMGIFAEAYWNLGWIGIPVVMIPLAFAFDILGRMAIDIQKRSRWLHFPIALASIFMGMHVDSDIVGSQIVPLVTCLVLYQMANYIDVPLRSLFSAPLQDRPAVRSRNGASALSDARWNSPV